MCPLSNAFSIVIVCRQHSYQLDCQIARQISCLQERSENSRVSSEAAELHSLLQTGKAERQALLNSLEELRVENSALLQRVAQLDAKNDDQEKMLASVLSRSQGSGQQRWQGLNSTEDGIRPHSPRPDELVAPGEPTASPAVATPQAD